MCFFFFTLTTMHTLPLAFYKRHVHVPSGFYLIFNSAKGTDSINFRNTYKIKSVHYKEHHDTYTFVKR